MVYGRGENCMDNEQLIIGMGTRYTSLDKLKCICAFLIVCIHAPYPGKIGEYFISLTRIAVPVFFMISGFFYSKNNRNTQISKVFKLLIISNVIYLLWGCLLAMLRGELSLYLSNIFTGKNILSFLFLNETHISAHLWYLGALLYVLIIEKYLSNIQKEAILIYLSPFLLIMDLLLGKYSLVFFGKEFPYIFVRNWLFVGLPFFSIGVFIRNHYQQIKQKFSSRSLGICFILLFSATTILERMLLEHFEKNAVRDQYLSTIFLSISIFIYFLLFVSKGENCISAIGKNEATWIYILHPLLISITSVIAEKLGIGDYYIYVRPFVVFLVAIIIVFLLLNMRKRVRHMN